MLRNSRVNPPTKIQRLILDFIQKSTEENGFSPTLKEIAQNVGGRSIPTIHQHIIALEKKGLLSKRQNSPRSLVADTEEHSTIPLLGTIAAGNPIGVFEDPIPIAIPKSMISKKEDHYALKVSGNSMVQDGILDKDVVIIKHQQNANPGDVIVAIITDEFGNETATLKTYYPRMSENKIELRPKNPNYPPIIIRPKNLEIRGKFVGLIRSE